MAKRNSSFLAGLLTILLTVLILDRPWNLPLQQIDSERLTTTIDSTGTSSIGLSFHSNRADSPPDRLAEAVLQATLLKRFGTFTQLFCPENQTLGHRPSNHLISDVGGRCEPWQNREMIEVLSGVLDSSMVALEWSSGSGTLWMLRKGLTLHSVEHCGPWLQDIGRKLPSVTPDVQKWFPHHVARQDGNGCSQGHTELWGKNERTFGNYVRYPREHLLEKYAPNGFDFVSIDGRFRDGCLVEAVSLRDPQEPMLVKKEYGMLLFDNAERTRYYKPQEIPSFWLVVSFINDTDETALWMSCPSADDEACTRARKKIASYMADMPQEFVGTRYKDHMARAKKDGVPGLE